MWGRGIREWEIDGRKVHINWVLAPRKCICTLLTPTDESLRSSTDQLRIRSTCSGGENVDVLWTCMIKRMNRGEKVGLAKWVSE